MDIAKDCTPIASLTSPPHTGFKIGILQGEQSDAPDFLEPMAAEELALLGVIFLNAPHCHRLPYGRHSLPKPPAPM
jgi:hypothetical protein